MNIYHTLLPPTYNNRVHPNTLNNMDKWLSLNKDLNLKRIICNNNYCREFLNFFDKKYNFNTLKFFDLESDGRYKSDIFRICILYEEGGLYVDIDQEPLLPISIYLNIKEIDFCAGSNMGLHNVSNGFIFSKKGSIILFENIKEMIYRYENNGPKGGCHSLGHTITKLTNSEPFKMPVGECLIGNEKCLFLHEIGDESISNQIEFFNSFGYYTNGDTLRVMNSRYNTYYIDKQSLKQFIQI